VNIAIRETLPATISLFASPVRYMIMISLNAAIVAKITGSHGPVIDATMLTALSIASAFSATKPMTSLTPTGMFCRTLQSGG
jgi:hypothetical protein